jgi:pimeloyl-ACP methyl ester carboxylesterase
VVIEGAGHAANIDQPAAFNQALLEFLKGAHLM